MRTTLALIIWIIGAFCTAYIINKPLSNFEWYDGIIMIISSTIIGAASLEFWRNFFKKGQ